VQGQPWETVFASLWFGDPQLILIPACFLVAGKTVISASLHPTALVHLTLTQELEPRYFCACKSWLGMRRRKRETESAVKAVQPAPPHPCRTGAHCVNPDSSSPGFFAAWFPENTRPCPAGCSAVADLGPGLCCGTRRDTTGLCMQGLVQVAEPHCLHVPTPRERRKPLLAWTPRAWCGRWCCPEELGGEAGEVHRLLVAVAS